jgi:transcriptional regulator with XRE-family HTH domain
MWETSKREPDINTIIKLSSFFNIDIDYLLGHTKEPIKPPDLINNDPELTEYLDQLANRSEMRMLFSLAKNATKADVETAVKIIEAIRGNGDVET